MYYLFDFKQDSINLLKSIVGGLLMTPCLIGCNNNVNEDVIIIDDQDAKEVMFEDVATDIRVIPLIAEEPIGAHNEFFCYGNEFLMSDKSGEYIYYFIDGKLKSKLHAVGRGRGEYLGITHFTYSPSRKLLLVSSFGSLEDIDEATTTILKYSVPDMKYVGKISIEGKCTALSAYSETAFLASVANLSMDTCKIILADIETGNTINNICNQSYYSYLQSDATITYYGENNCVFSVPGYVNRLYDSDRAKYTSRLSFSFGEKNIPEKYLRINLSGTEYFLGLMQFMTSEDAKDCLEGGFLPTIDKNKYSFWYHKALFPLRDHYYSYENGEVVNYYGFYVPGLFGPILPDYVTGNDYIKIFEGGKDRFINGQVEPSTLGQEISDVLNSQTDDNPVILMYKIQ